MSRIVSGFLAGANYNVPVGYSLLVLQVVTWDRNNLSTASFSVVKSGYSDSVSADSSGRAMLVVPAGTYTVSLTHSGTYLNDDPQTVVAGAEEIVWVTFALNEPAVAVHRNLTASSWVSDSTYDNYPYRCNIAISGVESDDVAFVTFASPQAESGNYNNICNTYNGGVTIYSAVNTPITVPVILVCNQ